MPFRPCERCGARGYGIVPHQGYIEVRCPNGHLLAYARSFRQAQCEYCDTYWIPKEADE